jgi:hypothetical protein
MQQVGPNGFLLADYEAPKELTASLQPYRDLMAWDVRAMIQNDYATRIKELREEMCSGQL